MYDSLRPELLTATEKQRKLMRSDPVHVVTKERVETKGKDKRSPVLEVVRLGGEKLEFFGHFMGVAE